MISLMYLTWKMQSWFRLPPQKAYAIPRTPLARNATSVRADVKRTRPPVIPLAMNIKYYQHAV